ncbi:MAG: transposase [Spirochaetales bacterium]|nr:transposase [Spirochaetales bacterium]
MFKKSLESSPLNIFTSPKSLFSGNSLKMYEDEQAWHNQFRKQVTMRIDENIFRPLYCQDNGTPNASVRVLVAMMVLKEAEGLSDQKIFENCHFNLLVRSAIGLPNADDPVPTESTYYLFRKRIQEYAKKENENLFETAFAQITKDQCGEFEVSGKRIRMDSKLLGSNIAWLSRYELIHETLRLFYDQVKQSGQLNKATEDRLDELLQLEGNKVVYICSSEEVKSRLQELGELIYKILPLFSSSTSAYYQILQRVFNEQYRVDEKKVVVAREKEEISAKSVQSPYDTDCHYRNKDDQKVKGYSINITESCDDDKPLNLIGHVDVRKASASDTCFLQHDIEKAQEVFPDKIQAAHADGAYHSPDNQQYCKDNEIDLYLHAIQGAKSRYQFNFSENGELSVFDTIANLVVDSKMIISKDGTVKWRIKTENAYRYFTQKDIDGYLIRKQIAETPIETLQFRNNVEATIFQLSYHYPNAKSRYRGEIKHQMWANIRCLWVNFVRILKYIKQLCQRTSFFAKYAIRSIISELYFAINSILTAILPNNLSSFENTRFYIA